MANREENLKKINAELEQLSDEELEKVAGGCALDTANDSYMLYEMGLLDEYWDAIDIAFTPGTGIEDKVAAAFARVGIRLEYTGATFSDNKYYCGQRSISQQEAWSIAKGNAIKMGIYVNRSGGGDCAGGDF